jgi:chaperone BCS1
MSNTTSEFEPIMGVAADAKLMSTRLRPFSHPSVLAALGDPADATHAVVHGELASLISDYVVALPVAHSFEIYIAGKSTKVPARREARMSLGLGLVEVPCPAHVHDAARWLNTHTENTAANQSIFVLKHELGEPVGTTCSATIYSELVLIVKGRARLGLLQAFCDHIIELADKTEPSTFTISRWHIRNQYWQREQRARARSLTSVVLPEATMQDLIRDVDDFVSKETAAWYSEHGIPYKRGYLFYGVPGAGKTSLIQALAGKYCRNLCYLSPTHPDMTDDSLKNAIVCAAPNSIIVLEDVDALFGPKRQANVAECPLTFSGLLNALDGVGPGGGAIVILTSNHRELLDPALLRPGRVDKHVHFGHATPEQCAALFLQFFPSADKALAQRFSDNVAAALGDRQLAMAGLQQYLIAQRKSTAEVAATADSVASIVKEFKSREEGPRELAATAQAVASIASQFEAREEESRELLKKLKASEEATPAAAELEQAKNAPGSDETHAESGTTPGGKQIHVHIH